MLSVFVLVVAGLVPKISAGPDLAKEAKVLIMPIEQVTVFSDRALVQRKKTYALPAGVQVLRLPDLPGAVWMDSLRVESSLGKVLRVEATPVERERFSIDQVDEYIKQLQKLTDQRDAIDVQAQLFTNELDLLSRATPLAPTAPEERKSGGQPALNAKSWTKVMDFLYVRRSQDRAELMNLRDQRLKITKEISKLQRQIEQKNLGAFSQNRVQVLLILQMNKAARTSLSLEYFVPGAAWLPNYELHFDPEKGRAVLQTAAQIWQASGEEWSDVSLNLSTSMPGRGIEIPQLMTWTLGEKREWKPRAQAVNPPPIPRTYPKPAVQNLRAQQKGLLNQRLATLRSLLQQSPGSSNLVTGSLAASLSSGLDDTGAAQAARMQSRDKDWRRRRPRKKSRQRSAPAPRMAYAEADQVMPMTESLAIDMPREQSVSANKRRPSHRVRRTSLALFEPQAYHQPRLSNPMLPANLAAGLDYIYKAAARGQVPSDGQKVRVPLSSESYPVKTFYEATPALSKTAYLRASVVNKGLRPILRGPVAIFVGGDFTGDGELQTTGRGGHIALPLGADEDIRIQYRIEPKTETEGFIGKKEVTTYRVIMQLANYKKRAIELLVHDQIPKRNNEDIEVKLLSTSPKLHSGPDATGMLDWRVKIPAGKARSIEYRYQIIRPEGFKLMQR